MSAVTPEPRPKSLMLHLDGVDKSFKRGGQSIVVLEELSLKVPTGEFLALMGPSGSGKSTLLNLIGGLDRPSHGSVVVDGQSIDSLKSSELTRWRARNIGFVFQFYNLMPVLNALNNVALPLMLTNLSHAERRKRAEIALGIVGLGHRLKQYPRTLSGGEQQRVGIARALITDPKILLCDEPTGDLDRASARDVLDLLQVLNRDLGKTIVMVTHDPQAAECATRILHLDKGRLIRESGSGANP
ncbi:ABC transporter ATP-binding protein [Acanthopleuribacter pedis]|uniref:ABC transporter ATP-binding protein n=1 Tax=Acanthopleuribacter pedis TaxID=442870 RepID=A0A8J7QDU9_9BACT|nr:ABC transporter ATP-binding protein [Acanthopleuribacter pedis]MBO1322737.1 ABC transporter ATP-binding protein [Acanthopleuribacter pedis]